MNGSWSRPGVVMVACGLMFGCASMHEQDLAEVRSIAEQARADAAAATQAAAEAQARADAAMQTAADAKAQSDETESKIDRMFKKAMYK